MHMKQSNSLGTKKPSNAGATVGASATAVGSTSSSSGLISKIIAASNGSGGNQQQ